MIKDLAAVQNRNGHQVHDGQIDAQQRQQ